MAEGLSAYTANAILNCIGNATTFTGIAQCYIQLHVGAPGAAGTANLASETSRKAISFGAPVNGVMSNDAIVEWIGISGSQDATHYTLWDASAGGNFLASGTITAGAYTAGDTYTFAVGDIDLVFAIAS